MIYKDRSIVINSVDLSSSLRALTMTETQAMQDASADGDDWLIFEAGLQGVTVSADFWQDYSSGGVDETLSGLLGTASFTVVVKSVSGSPSGTNPSFTATMAIESYERFTGTIGDRALCSVTFALVADTGMVRAES